MKFFGTRVAVLVLSAFAVASTAQAAGRCGDVAARPWCDTRLSPDARAELLLQALTREERISLLAGDELTGVAGREGTHTGTSNGVARVGLPNIYFSDGPVGTRQGKATGMPSPLSLAASFDPELAKRHAAVVGDEVKKKGNDVVFAPAMNMQRTPLNGRTFEYFGEDPFLSARIAVGWTHGVQAQGIIANAKHFAVNNQEGAGPQPPGSPLGAGVAGNRLSVDARLDERTLREIYLPQFEATVKEGRAGSVMCSYPRVNGQYACENSHLLEDVLKGDWGFRGFVLTDYGAAKSTSNSLNNGLDLDIWPAIAYRPELVNASLASGQASEATVDEHVRRQLRTLFAYGFFDRPAYVDDTSKIDQSAHGAEAAAIEEQGVVLLKNERALLPLDAARVGKVALIGPEADAIKDGGGSSAIDEFKLTTPRQAFAARLGSRLVYHDGSDRAAVAEVARGADVAIVVVGDRMSEGSDKPCMDLSCGQTDGINREALIEAVAAAQPKTLVLLQSGGPVVTPWRDKVPAILEAWFPGQNGGTAMSRVIFGDAEPGGRLPTTFPVSEADEPTAGDPEKYPGVGETVRYKEGVLIGYRWFDEMRKPVAFPFGFGLTYTTFSYSDLRLEPAAGNDVRGSALVRNTGPRAGTAVPQLYVGMPEPRPSIVQPPFQLKGFSKVALAPGASRRVTFTLDDRAFSYWAGSRWEIAPGCYRVGVGAHSRDLPLQGIVGRGAQCDGALVLPTNARRCAPGRRFSILLPRAMRSATVHYSGRMSRARLVRGRLRATIDLRRVHTGRVLVRVIGRDRSERVLRQTRLYHTCAACTSASRFAIVLPSAFRSARVSYAGRTVTARVVRGRLRATLDLRGLRPGGVVTRAVGRDRAGRLVRQTRVVRICPKPRT
ncbi:MAG: beta-glucosidase [Solirubrobacteraceae bacterium]|nr:beta-glucosidase [Solirubrobacteraceae bacterium]